MVAKVDPTQTLRRVSQRLSKAFRECGVEETPSCIADALLIQCGNETWYAIHNGNEYLDGNRPLTELLMEVKGLHNVQAEHATPEKSCPPQGGSLQKFWRGLVLVATSVYFWLCGVEVE